MRTASANSVGYVHLIMSKYQFPSSPHAPYFIPYARDGTSLLGTNYVVCCYRWFVNLLCSYTFPFIPIEVSKLAFDSGFAPSHDGYPLGLFLFRRYFAFQTLLSLSNQPRSVSSALFSSLFEIGNLRSQRIDCLPHIGHLLL